MPHVGRGFAPRNTQNGTRRRRDGWMNGWKSSPALVDMLMRIMADSQLNPHVG